MGESEPGADPGGNTVSDAARIQETFSRVMQKVRSAYTKELQRKKQVDLNSSVDIMRKNIEETNDMESNEDDEALQAMTKVQFNWTYCLDKIVDCFDYFNRLNSENRKLK